MKVATLQLISNLGFFSPFEVLDPQSFLDLDTDLSSDYDSDLDWPDVSSPESTTFESPVPQLPDLVMSARPQKTGQKYEKKVASKRKLIQNEKVTPFKATPEKGFPHRKIVAKSRSEPSIKQKVVSTPANKKVVMITSRSRRKIVRPKRFQEAFDELELLAKKYKAEIQIDRQMKEDSDSDEVELDESLKCEKCDRYFRSQNHLERHWNEICSRRCVECQITFKDEEAFKGHTENEHQPLSLIRKSLVNQKKKGVKSSKPSGLSRPRISTESDEEDKPLSKLQKRGHMKKPRKIDPNASRRCCLINCPNIPGNAKYLCTFPKEPDLAEKWEAKVARANNKRLTPSDAYVCSKHFREDLYMGSGLLKPNSVPSIFRNPKKRKSVP